jgi:excisionase family DNA binding protein
MAKPVHFKMRQGRARQKTAQDSLRRETSRVPVGELAQYITTRRAAELLGVTRFQVFHLITAKRIQGVKLGHDWLVLTSSVENYFKTKSSRGRPAKRAAQIEIR